MKLSISQLEAIQTNTQEVTVAAGAGSGKTTLLIERFLHAVLNQKIPANQIVAITFTNKAAQELKNRLEEAFKISQLRESIHLLDEGNIATIHSFCVKLLAEYPIDAHIDPQFVLIEDEEATLLKEEAYRKALDEWLATGDERKMDLFVHADPYVVQQAVFALNDQLRAKGDLPKSIVLDAHPIHTAWQNCCDDVQEVIEALEDDDRNLKRYWDILKTHGSRPTEPASLIHQWNALKEIKKILGSIRKANLKESTQLAKESCEAFTQHLIEELCGPANQYFLELLTTFRNRYQTLKAEKSLIDFDDQMEFAYALIQKPYLAHYLKTKIKLLLVDEFQDVNWIQFKLIHALSQGTQSFYVGDIRQSIYGFRFAESHLFAAKLTDTSNPEARALTMAENHRSRPDLIHFTNRLFAEEMASSHMAFASLIPKRLPYPEPRCHIEFLIADRSDSKSLNQKERKQYEFDRVIQHLKNIVNNPSFIIHSSHSEPRQAEWGDIAILLRKTTHAYLLEQTLRDAHIPYQMMIGSGFFNRLEILDLLNVLKVCVWPNDLLALLSILRSPLVGLSDDALVTLTALAERPLTVSVDNPILWHKLKSEDQERLNVFRSWMHELRLNRLRMNLIEILDFITQKSAYFSYLQSLTDGQRRMDNIFKFKEILAHYEATSAGTIEEFLRRVDQKRIDEMDDEREALPPSEKSQKTLQVMTIHAAKGLEFPIVVIPELADSLFKKPHTIPFALTEASEIVSSLPNPEGEGRLASFYYEKTQERQKEKDLAEAKRLLYVAMTRPTEHLILSTQRLAPTKSGEESDAKSWFDFIANHFPPLRYAPENTLEIYDNFQIHYYVCKERMSAQDSASGTQPEKNIEHEEYKNQPQNESEGMPPSVIARRERSERRSNLPEKNLYSYNLSISDFARWRVKDNIQKQLIIHSQHNLDIHPAWYGDLIHRILQKIDHHSSLDEQKEAILKAHPFLKRAELQSQIWDAIERFYEKSQEVAWLRARQSFKMSYRELPFHCRVASPERTWGFLKGQMDLIVQTKPGEWVLVDYKTGSYESEQYHEQLRLYAWCFEQLTGEKVVEAHLYYIHASRFIAVDTSVLRGPQYTQALIKDYQDAIRGMLE